MFTFSREQTFLISNQYFILFEATHKCATYAVYVCVLFLQINSAYIQKHPTCTSIYGRAQPGQRRAEQIYLCEKDASSLGEN